MFHDFNHILFDWLVAHGPLLLFFLLSFGIVALPIPDDSILFFAGVLIGQGKLDLTPTLIAAISGSFTGITISYFLGRYTAPLIIRKFGKHLRLTQKRMDYAEKWFARIGKWTLTICYFIPLLRHIAGFAAGSSQLKMKSFMLFAYTGALIWIASYLTLGYFVKKIPDWLAM